MDGVGTARVETGTGNYQNKLSKLVNAFISHIPSKDTIATVVNEGCLMMPFPPKLFIALN
jgi:hypothetical protein